MEWTGWEQVRFLMESIVVGIGQGLFIDIVTGIAHGSKRKRWLWTDVVCGPIAAVITFFGALVIMDGQLHPLLLFGVFLGMLAEHIAVGSRLERMIRRTLGWVKQGTRMGFGCTVRFIGKCVRLVKRIPIEKPKRPKKGEKSPNLSQNF